LQQVDKESVRI